MLQHLLAAPTFFPPFLDNIGEWEKREDMRIFIVRNSEEIMGFMAVGDDGENVIADYQKMQNICGAYFDENYHGQGIAQQHFISGENTFKIIHIALQEELMSV